ncbi:MAG: hypothetical protein NZ954_02880 [Thermofilaceae archaeon]|nr:hypothetical protein [Thermofilaceae archaeon]MCX8181195.1 hypothetical protein [Thermofilaceae archaeon]MDW8004482.1 hypothetical protein [Thermofilaceae archaeon]
MYENAVTFLRETLGNLLQGSLSAVNSTILAYAMIGTLRGIGYLSVNKRKMKRIEAEIQSWEIKRSKALETRNLKSYNRIMREKARIEKLKREMEVERLKASVVTFVSWIILFKILWDAVGHFTVVQIPLPMGYVKASFSMWFLLNSIWATPLLNRIVNFINFLRRARA